MHDAWWHATHDHGDYDDEAEVPEGCSGIGGVEKRQCAASRRDTRGDESRRAPVRWEHQVIMLCRMVVL